MKQSLIFLSLTFVVVLAYGQTFAPLGARWYYSASANGMAPQGSEYYLYESTKDTIVGGHSCKKLNVTYYKYLNGDTAYLPPVFLYQVVDTVYYYNTIYLKYFPLYIFNVSQGDTLTFHSPDIPFNPIDTIWKAVVDSVTSLTISSETLKRVWTTSLGNYSFHGSYIEKLGSDFLMFHQPMGLILEHDGPMRCYSDSSLFYNFTTLPCDYRLTTEMSELINRFKFSFYPNPASNSITFELKSSVKKVRNSYLTITNLIGQQISRYDIASSCSTIVANTETYTPGIYFYSIYYNGTITETQKFIIR